MAEGFEVYHVPQQSRRDKLRVGIIANIHPSLIPSHFDFPQNPSFNFHNNHFNNYPSSAVAAVSAADQPLSLELNLQQRYPSSAIPILKGSKFLNPVQQLLHELFDFPDVLPPDSAVFDPLFESLGGDVAAADGGADCRSNKSRLVTMLDEVYRRYKLYYQQMQAVVATFEYAAGLGNAAPYVNLAVKAMFKHFRFLKNAIVDQLQFNKQQQLQPYNPYCLRSIPNNNATFLDHQPVWRPQRGLPESAVTILRAWLFEHFLHPYPTDTDKLMLANQTGLSRSQVSNWFINARVRLWKPMVEEIHMLETKQAQKSQQKETNNGNTLNSINNHVSSTNKSLKAEHNINNKNNASSSNHDHHHHQPQDLSNSSFFPTNHPYAAVGTATMGGGGNVSLTLGLHQNHGGITLAEAFPINVAPPHFNLGLEANGEGFVNEWF